MTQAEPSYADEYVRILGVPVRFQARRNALRINPAILQETVAPQSRYALEVFRARAEALLQEMDDTHTMRALVEKRLMPGLATSRMSMSEVAADMHMTRQTLFRRLRAEGTTFEEVRDDLRRRMATHSLTAQKRPVISLL